MGAIDQTDKDVLGLLQQGCVMAAKDLLATKTPVSSEQKLRHLYCEAKVSLYEGAYLKALAHLQAYNHQLPEDLEVLCDIALCLYQLGLQAELELTLHQTSASLKNQIASLAPQKIVDCSIFIAKLFEEQGHHEKAQEMLSLAQVKELSAAQVQSLRIQNLRIAIELQNSKATQALYSQVLSGTEHSLNFEIEREHSLLLADFYLFGFQQALERFDYIMSKEISLADQNFLNGELAELAILSQNFQILEKLKITEESESSYEKIQARIIHYYLAGHTDVDLSIIRLEKTLSRMSLLRILRQALMLFSQSPQLESWIKRYRFHCLNVSSKSLQNIFLATLIGQTNDEKILVNSSLQVIAMKGKEHKLKSQLFWQLRKAFSEGQKEVAIEDVIQIVYQETPNSQHFDRLRIAISRLNASFKNSYNIETLYKINKHKVILLVPIQEKAS